MEDNLYILTFLMGTDYALTKNLKSTKDTLVKLTDQHIGFRLRLLRHLYKLSTVFDLKKLAQNLHLPRHTLELYITQYKSPGFCIICDRFYSKVRDHVSFYHLLTFNEVNEFFNKFAKDCEFFMPKEHKGFNVLDLPYFGRQRPKARYDTFQIKLVKDPLPVVQFSKPGPEIRPDLIGRMCSICSLCEDVLPTDKEADHTRFHQRHQLVQCPRCHSTLKRKDIGGHIKTCKSI